MKNMKPELWNAQAVAAQNAEAREVFRGERMGTAARHPLTHAAAAVSASTDEMLAKVAYFTRRNATHTQPVPATVGVEAEVQDGELVA
ncbi:MAG: hypothetical protein HC911_12340 [Chloroflexaceae bacterium]|nr:hypothetical protein [Chloroflexaceae bacterium]